MKNKTVIMCLVLAFLTITQAYTQKNPDLAKTPPMGWNSWNWFGKQDINEQIVREVIDAIVSTGLKDAGYIYVVVDGGWRDVKLGSGGELLPHPEKFPNGIKPLADYAHSKGLKFGVHTVPGTQDCGGDPVGGFNREEIHIKQFVEWGLDFVKVDLCRQTEDPCATCEKSRTGWSDPTIKETYVKWSKLLRNCGRDILFSISAYRFRDWYPEYCNMARTTQDIKARIHKGGAFFNSPSRENAGFLSVMTVAEITNQSAAAAGNGFWNDPDMMVTGNQGLTPDEEKSHFALWCMMASPLMLGNDPRNMSAEEKKLIMNKEMIAVNQDPEEQGRIVKSGDETQVWTKKLADGRTAVLLLNLSASEREVKADLKEIGLPAKVKVRDIINGKDMGTFKKSIALKAGKNACWFLVTKK